MLSWDDLEALSVELSNKAEDLVPQVVDLNSQLGKLQSSLSDSVTLLAQSLSMRKQEAQAAQAAVKSALHRSTWWQRGALTVAGAFGGYVGWKWPGCGYGAAAGLAIDAVLEVISFKVKL
jgi:hypothetical protein